MRLLDVDTGKLTEFQNNIPDYAILSHVWGKEEVTFRDIADLDKAKKMHGYAKIRRACRTTVNDGFKYIWIDTCCINKESSAELSEAINSMYVWYKKAAVCYAYLADVPSEDDHENPCSLFMMSLWFTRGWTLQELIAPSRVVFYGKDWVDIGTKATLQKTISAVTGISTESIVGASILDNVPIAVRMSWAADRNTTREEDVAYSLMGLFNVNMPLLYGEGRIAFIRLQHEIIKKSNDHSIFAWTNPTDDVHRGILARSPSEFRGSSNVERILSPPSRPGDGQSHDSTHNIHPRPYSITNHGLHIELPIVVPFPVGRKGPTLASLNCRFSGISEPIVIALTQSDSLEPSDYVRSNTRSLQNIPEGESSAQISSLYIADDYSKKADKNAIWVVWGVEVPTEYGNLHGKGIHCNEVAGGMWISNLGAGQTAFLVLEEPHRPERFAVIVGVGEAIWCDVSAEMRDQEIVDILASHHSAAASGWAKKTQYLDRTSVVLAHGWSVHVSCEAANTTLSDTFTWHVKIKIMQSPKPKSPIPPLKRPDRTLGCLVIPPAPGCGFVVDTNDLQQHSPDTNWVQHLGSFILYIRSDEGEEEAGSTAGVLTFKGSNSEEEFSLLVDSTYTGEISSGIEMKRPEDPSQALLENKNSLIATYSVVLEGGKLVFVTVRQCRENSVADYIIRLMM